MGFGVLIVADSTLSGPAQEEMRRRGVVRALRRKLYIEPVSHREYVNLSWKGVKQVESWCFYTTCSHSSCVSASSFFVLQDVDRLIGNWHPQSLNTKISFYLSPKSYRHWLLIDSLSLDNDYGSDTIRYGCYQQSLLVAQSLDGAAMMKPTISTEQRILSAQFGWDRDKEHCTSSFFLNLAYDRAVVDESWILL
jgi:hypothetical protein